MSAADNTGLRRGLYDYHLALVANSGLTPESFKQTQESARDDFEELIATIRPWEGHDKSSRLDGVVEEFRRDWKEFAGWDLEDKEALAKWEAETKANYEKHDAEQAALAEEEETRDDRFEEAKKRVEERRARSRR
jgi:hypothetical protein